MRSSRAASWRITGSRTRLARTCTGGSAARPRPGRRMRRRWGWRSRTRIVVSWNVASQRCRNRPGPFDYWVKGKQLAPLSRRYTMRFLIIVKATKDSEAGVMPEDKLIAEMGKFHEELAKAGLLIDGAGLKASSRGWRIKYDGDKRSFVDGPF